MLYSKKILVKWNSHNKRSFVKLGYIFTKYGDLFEVDINNAPKYSRELITLCESCHKKFHKIYGKINIGKKEILEYISNQSVTTTRDECNGGESLNVGERLALPEVENNLYFNKDEEIV